MSNKYMFLASAMPANLGAAFATQLWSQSDTFGLPSISTLELNRLLLDAEDLTGFDQRTLDSQRRFYPADRLRRDKRTLLQWAKSRILRTKDQTALNHLMDFFGIVYLEDTIDCMLELNARDPQLVTLLLEGRVGAAIRHVPKSGYPHDDDEQSWSVEHVMDLIAIVLRLWIAHDLQLEAAAAHVRIFRPTGCNMLDYVASGWPIQQAALIARLDEELKLYFYAKRLYEGQSGAEQTAAGSSPDGHTSAGAAIVTSSARFVLRWPTSEPKEFRRDATAAEAAVFPVALHLRAQLALAQWRRAHGDDLEEFIKCRIRDAEWRMKRLQRELDAIRYDRSQKSKRAHVQKGEEPLTRLWLACQAAALWVDRINPPKRGRKSDWESALTQATDFVDEAIRKVRGGDTIKLPKMRDHHNATARELFFALRCTIARDPEHLPTALRTVDTMAGQSVPTKRREDAERLRGRPFTFKEIYAHQESRRLGLRDSKELLSHTFIGAANRFRAAHAKVPTLASREILQQAAGTAAWRLQP
jgi:hypothetical protein